LGGDAGAVQIVNLSWFAVFATIYLIAGSRITGQPSPQSFSAGRTTLVESDRPVHVGSSLLAICRGATVLVGGTTLLGEGTYSALGTSRRDLRTSAGPVDQLGRSSIERRVTTLKLGEPCSLDLVVFGAYRWVPERLTVPVPDDTDRNRGAAPSLQERHIEKAW
jgi:hypothetical protein